MSDQSSESEKVAFWSLAIPEARVWAFGTEEEILLPPITRRKDYKPEFWLRVLQIIGKGLVIQFLIQNSGYKEVAKLLVAFHRGIKRANPDAIVLPSGGTSGYSKVRGHDAIEGYLSSTEGIIKWDAVAVHPYGSCDGTLGQTDLDQTVQMLSDSMKKFGYGQKTPINFNEGGGQDKPALWGDGPDYSYTGGPPSYDQGLREFMHACYMARQYIICLKYWPRLEHFNCWTTFHNTVLDHNLTPTTGLLGINTLGHLLGNPTFVSDIRPAPGTRGSSFVDEKPQTGKMFQWNKSYQIKQTDTKPQTQSWEMDYFYVPHIKSPIDWDSIPAIPMNNMFRPTVNLKQTPGWHPGDINATFKLAWDKSNLYLRVDAQDDHFNPVSPTFWSSSEAQKNHLYLLDGCLEVYFDCGANGRRGNGGFDMDDTH